MEIKNKQNEKNDYDAHINKEAKRGGRPQDLSTDINSNKSIRLDWLENATKIPLLLINYRSDESDKSHFILSMGFAVTTTEESEKKNKRTTKIIEFDVIYAFRLAVYEIPVPENLFWISRFISFSVCFLMGLP